MGPGPVASIPWAKLGQRPLPPGTRARPGPSGREDLAPKGVRPGVAAVSGFRSALLGRPHKGPRERRRAPHPVPLPGEQAGLPPSRGDRRCAAGPEDRPLPLPHADAGGAGDLPGPEAAPGAPGRAAAARRPGQGEPVGPESGVPEQERWVAAGSAGLCSLTVAGCARPGPGRETAQTCPVGARPPAAPGSAGPALLGGPAGQDEGWSQENLRPHRGSTPAAPCLSRNAGTAAGGGGAAPGRAEALWGVLAPQGLGQGHPSPDWAPPSHVQGLGTGGNAFGTLQAWRPRFREGERDPLGALLRGPRPGVDPVTPVRVRGGLPWAVKAWASRHQQEAEPVQVGGTWGSSGGSGCGAAGLRERPVVLERSRTHSCAHGSLLLGCSNVLSCSLKRLRLSGKPWGPTPGVCPGGGRRVPGRRGSPGTSPSVAARDRRQGTAGTFSARPRRLQTPQPEPDLDGGRRGLSSRGQEGGRASALGASASWRAAVVGRVEQARDGGNHPRRGGTAEPLRRRHLADDGPRDALRCINTEILT